jgi:hypothetical protein
MKLRATEVQIGDCLFVPLESDLLRYGNIEEADANSVWLSFAAERAARREKPDRFDSARTLLHHELAATPSTNLPIAGQLYLMSAATEGQFVTSDRPVVLTRDSPGAMGLADLAVQILFPLSSGIAIIGGVDLTAAAVPVERRVVAEMNAKIAWNANRQIYARDERFEYVSADGQVKTGPDLAIDPAFALEPPA